MRLAKIVMNTTISMIEMEKDVKSKCLDPYGWKRSIIGGDMTIFSIENGDPHPRVHSCNHYDDQLRSVR